MLDCTGLDLLLPLLAREASPPSVHGTLLFRASVPSNAMPHEDQGSLEQPLAPSPSVALLAHGRARGLARLVESREGSGSRFVTSARHIIRPCRLLHCIFVDHSHGLCPSLSLHVHTAPCTLLTNLTSLPCSLLATPILPAHLSPWRTRRIWLRAMMASKSLSLSDGTS